MILKQITNTAGDHIVGEIFCIGFVFIVRPTKETHLEIFAQNEKHQCKNKPISKKTR